MESLTPVNICLYLRFSLLNSSPVKTIGSLRYYCTRVVWPMNCYLQSTHHLKLVNTLYRLMSPELMNSELKELERKLVEYVLEFNDSSLYPVIWRLSSSSHCEKRCVNRNLYLNPIDCEAPYQATIFLGSWGAGKEKTNIIIFQIVSRKRSEKLNYSYNWKPTLSFSLLNNFLSVEITSLSWSFLFLYSWQKRQVIHLSAHRVRVDIPCEQT